MSTDDSIEDLIERHRVAVVAQARSQLKRAAGLIQQFTAFAVKRGVVLDTSSFTYIPTIGIVASAPSLANRVLGAINRQRDDLISVADLLERHQLSRYQSGYYIGANYMLMVHPFFRRGMQGDANFAPRFVDAFWELDSQLTQKYIAIDENRVRINVDASAYLERDAWYGAPFTSDIANIANGVVKLRPPPDIQDGYVDFLFAQAHCLDIKWSQEGQIKTFQALEIKSPCTQVTLRGATFHPARYLHAEYDLSAGAFRHFDGAVQLMSEDEYLQRRDLDFHVNAKQHNHLKPISKKLFKLNGSLSTELWVELCCQFFTGNPLAFEYFSGRYPDHVTDALNRIRARAH